MDWASLSVWLIGLFRALFFGFWVSCLALVAFVVSCVFCRFFSSFLFSLVASGFIRSFCLECLSGFCRFLAVLAVLAFLAFWLLLPIVGLRLVGSPGRCSFIISVVSGYRASVWNRLDSAADDHWSSFVQTKPGYQPRKGFCMLDRVGQERIDVNKMQKMCL